MYLYRYGYIQRNYFCYKLVEKDINVTYKYAA